MQLLRLDPVFGGLQLSVRLMHGHRQQEDVVSNLQATVTFRYLKQFVIECAAAQRMMRV